MAPDDFMSDPWMWVAGNLVEVGVAAAFVLVQICVMWVIFRERLIRKIQGTVPPERRGELRANARRVGLFHRRPTPKDPYDLRTAIVIPPLGDGRPGEGFLAPGPSNPPGPVQDLDGRMDATLPLAAGTWMLVYCSGRVGARLDDFVVLPAAERVLAAREKTPDGASLLGPVDRVPSRAGEGWRTTMVFASGKALTDTHVDHDGWAYIIGVLSSSHHARAVDVLDTILSTWKWLAAEPARPAWDEV